MKLNKLFLIGFFFIILCNTVSATWWNATWNSKEQINFSNTWAINITNRMFHITVNMSGKNVQSDCSDIRFLNSNENVTLSHYIYSCNNTGNTNVNLVVPTCSASANCTIYMYYDNTSAVTTANNISFASGISDLTHYFSFDNTSELNSTNYANSSNVLVSKRTSANNVSGFWGNGKSFLNYDNSTLTGILSGNFNFTHLTLIYAGWAKDNTKNYNAGGWVEGYNNGGNDYLYAAQKIAGTSYNYGFGGDFDLGAIAYYPNQVWFLTAQTYNQSGASASRKMFINRTTIFANNTVTATFPSSTWWSLTTNNNPPTGSGGNSYYDEIQIYSYNMSANEVGFIYDTYNQSYYTLGAEENNTAPPTNDTLSYSNLTNNATNTSYYGTNVLWSVFLNSSNLSLSSYTFSTNNSGSWVNDTPFLIFSGNNITYQENATSTAYNWTWDFPENVTDGNKLTYGYLSTYNTPAWYFFNYTIPAGINSSIWEVTDAGGTNNLTIPSDCFTNSINSSVLMLSAISFQATSPPPIYVYWNCYNGTNWNLLRNYSGSSATYKRVYEEGIYWSGGVSAANYTASVIKTIGLTKGNSICGKFYFNITNGTSNKTTNSCFTVANAIPSITITSPINNYHNNSNLTVGYSVSDSADDTVNCSLYVNNTINITSTNVTLNTPITITATGMRDGVYTWKLNCTDGLNYTNTSTYTFTVDTVNPIESIVGNPLNDNSTVSRYNLTMNITGFDANLWGYNLTVKYSNGTTLYTNLTTNLTPTTYRLSQIIPLPVTDNYSVIRCWADSHTANSWDKTAAVTKDKEKNKISYNFGDALISVELQSTTSKKKVKDVTTEKIKDRYTFAFDLSDAAAAKEEEYIFKLTSDKKLMKVQNSEYGGHYIVWGGSFSNSYWVDFEGQGTVEVLESTDSYAILKVKTNKDILQFNSIGGLNEICYSSSYYFDITPPNVTFISQNPSDITSSNIFSAGLNVTYNYTDNLSLTGQILYYKTNSTTSNTAYTINGTSYSGYFTNTNYSNGTYTLYEYAVYPANYNYNESIMRTTSHSSVNLISTSVAKVELINVSSTKQYTFLEVYIDNNSISSQPLDVYYCNSSYSIGMPIVNPFCTSIGSIANTDTFNHTHSVYSKHRVLPLAINTSSGTINTIKVTSTSYILFNPEGMLGWGLYGITATSRSTQYSLSVDMGTTYTADSTFMPDLHLHQYDGSDTFYRYSCATDAVGNTGCSTVGSDLINLSGLPPTGVQILAPTNNTYDGNIQINWTSGLSPNNYPIKSYNLSLLNSDLTVNRSIYNASNTTYNYSFNSSVVHSGTFLIQIVVFDNLSQSSTTVSNAFIINHTPSITLNNPTNGQNLTSMEVIFNWTASDYDSDGFNYWLYYSLNSSEPILQYTGTDNFYTADGVQNGTYKWYVTVYDNGGNYINSSNYTFSIVPPTLTIRARTADLNSTITSFTGVFTSGNQSINGTTTTGVLPVNLTFEVWNYVISSVGYGDIMGSISMLGGNQNVTVYMNRPLSLYIQIYYSNNTLASGTSVSLQLISPTYTNSYSTNTGIKYINYIPSNSYELIYSATGYETLKYYFIMNNSIAGNIKLYLIDAAAVPVTITLQDTDGIYAINYELLAQRYSSTDGSYQFYQMSKSNNNGQALMYFTLYDNWYKFLVQKNGIIYKITEPRIVDGDFTIIFSLTNITGLPTVQLGNIAASLDYYNATGGYFSYIYTDTSGLVSEGCLKVVDLLNNPICTSCSASTSATLICLTNGTNGTRQIGKGTVVYNGVEYLLLQKEVDFSTTGYVDMGKSGLFLAILLIIVAIIMFAIHPALAIIGSVLALIISVSLGLIYMTYASVAIIVIIGLFYLIFMRK